MMLPNREHAYIPKQKLEEYLLSETHAIGKAKARYFHAIGYAEQNAHESAEALLIIAKSNDVTKEVITPYGMKYIIEGELLPPAGTTVRIVTVWVVESSDDRPRFVTAYPA